MVGEPGGYQPIIPQFAKILITYLIKLTNRIIIKVHEAEADICPVDRYNREQRDHKAEVPFNHSEAEIWSSFCLEVAQGEDEAADEEED